MTQDAPLTFFEHPNFNSPYAYPGRHRAWHLELTGRDGTGAGRRAPGAAHCSGTNAFTCALCRRRKTTLSFAIVSIYFLDGHDR